MLQAITSDGMVHWQCYGGEKDEHCSAQLSAHASEAEYRLAPDTSGPRGAMIDLPACQACGARCELKADFTMKELWNVTETMLDANGGIYAYALKIRHTYTLMLHHYLYMIGKAEHAPILGLPSPEEISDPRLARLPADVVMSLWFGYKIVQWKDPRLTSFEMVLQELAALPAPEERKLLDGTAYDNQ